MKIALLGDSLMVGVAPFFVKRAMPPHDVQIVAKVGASISWMRNSATSGDTDVVLVMGGTNDLMSVSPAEAHKRMRELVTAYTGMRRTIVGTIPPMLNGKEAAAREYNELLRADATIDVAEVGSLLSTSDIGPDGIHPTAHGYQKMAEVWYDAVGRSPIARAGIAGSEGGLGIILAAAAAGAVVYIATKKGKKS